MSLTVLKLEVAKAARPQRAETVGFLIDSVAIYSAFPRAILERLCLGIVPLTDQTLWLALGQAIRRQVGVTLCRYQDRIGGASPIFGEETDAVLLGSHTLKALGLGLDPIRRELIQLPMMLAGTNRTRWLAIHSGAGRISDSLRTDR